MSARPFGPADEAVRAVRILQEVLGVAARISTAMLRKENAVRVVCPTGTSLPDVIGPEAQRKVSAGYSTADVFDEPAHDASVASTPPVAQPQASPIGRRYVRMFHDHGTLIAGTWMAALDGAPYSRLPNARRRTPHVCS
jgi:hypothetical protein